MKNKLILGLSLLTLSVAPSAFSYPFQHHCAPCNPFYIGAELGGSDLHYDKSLLAEDAVTISDRGFAGRLLAGYNFNRNVALELGYTMYNDPKFGYGRGIQADFSQQSVDLLAKFSVPIACNVSLYGKAGMALVHRDDARVVDGNLTIDVNDADDHLRPMLGVGVSYAFSPRVSGNVGYYRTFGADDLEDADFYGAGLTFRIG